MVSCKKGGSPNETVTLSEMVKMHGLTRSDLEGIYSPKTLDKLFEKSSPRKSKRKGRTGRHRRKTGRRSPGVSEAISERLMEEGR